VAKKSIGINIVAVVAAVVAGSLVNILLVNIGPSVVQRRRPSVGLYPHGFLRSHASR